MLITEAMCWIGLCYNKGCCCVRVSLGQALPAVIKTVAETADKVKKSPCLGLQVLNMQGILATENIPDNVSHGG